MTRKDLYNISKMTFSLEIEFKDITFDVGGTASPSTPDVFYLPNGDPGYPGDPAEIQKFDYITATVQATNGKDELQVDGEWLLDSFGYLEEFEERVLEEIDFSEPEREHDD